MSSRLSLRRFPIATLLFSFYAGGVIVWLVVGLLPTVVAGWPWLASTLAGHPTAWGGLAGRLVDASDYVDSAPRIVLESLFSVLNLGLGLLLVRRRGAELPARLIAIGMIGTAATFNHQSHSVLHFRLLGDPGDLHTLFHLTSGLAYLLAVLVFPDGRVVPFTGRRGARVTGSVYGVALLVIAFFVFAGIAQSHPGQPFFTVLFGLSVPLVGVAAQTYRLRNARDPVVRQQSQLLRWALLPMLGAGVAYVVVYGNGASGASDLGLAVFPALFALVPIALVVGILRYRLWDIDVFINKTLLSVGSAGFIGAVYVVVVVGVGSGLGSTTPPTWLRLVATAIAAVAFEPVRERLQRFANRLVYGRRATPYEAMAGFSARLATAISIDEVLPRVAEAAGSALGAASCRVALELPDGSSREVRWREPRRDRGGAGERFTVPVRYRDEGIGELTVEKVPGERVGSEDIRVLGALAGQAGLALNNARLALELERRLGHISEQADELRASRSRIVTAREALRQRVVALIHDRVEVGLEAAAAAIGRLVETVRTDPPAAVELADQVGEMTSASLEALRELARGIFPAILSDQGVVAALRVYAGRAGSVAIESDGVEARRFDPGVESSLYFGITACLRHVGAGRSGDLPVRIALADRDGRLSFTVSGEDTGDEHDELQDVRDRLEAIGGEFKIERDRGGRVVLSGWTPERS